MRARITNVTDVPRYARALWTLFEPIHAICYFEPEARAAFETAGLRGFWRGYFAGRVAPLGAMGPAPVIAVFNGFAPDMVRRALPDIWSMISPESALDARAAGAAATLRRLAPDADAVEAAVPVLEDAVARLDPSGRPLGAANADLPRRDDPYERLWQAATTLREHRGDSHVAALVAADLAGLPMLVLRGALDIGRAIMQPARGWTDEQWDVAADSLVVDGLLDGAGAVTDAGRRRVAEVERVTDQVAAGAWASLSTDEIILAAKALSPISNACAGALPDYLPIGVITAWDASTDPTAASVVAPGSSAGL
jgi:hypothetical protein